jgi:hypothetical protein
MLPKESSLLKGGKSFIKKGGGVLAVVSLGLNAWDDFHNHGLIAGGKRFGVDLLSKSNCWRWNRHSDSSTSRWSHLGDWYINGS